MARLRGLAALGAELEDLRASARGQATRIRLEALREAAVVSERLTALASAPEGSFDRLMGAAEAAIGRLGTPRFDDLALGSMLAATTVESSLAAELPPNGASGPAPAPVDGGGRRVSVDVGPFSDFSQLVSFEDAANAIGGTGEISIRRFSGGRASIEVDLSEPIDLLRELEQRCDFDLSVRARSDDEIVLDIGP